MLETSAAEVINFRALNLDLNLTPDLADTFALAKKAGKAYQSTVMIAGETGVGKTEIARHIHSTSVRSGKPFVKIDLSQATASLFEDELFGHEEGAYTGAKKGRTSRLSKADGGTVFLDEIGTLPFDLQARLLRLVQERKFSQLGSDKEIDIDVRFLAATSRNLEKMVRNGEFREDLYHRLNVLQIIVPPLRERRKDIIPLAEHFLHVASVNDRIARKNLSDEAKQALIEYGWPGNVRALQNEMSRATMIVDGDIIMPSDLSFYGKKGNVFSLPLSHAIAVSPEVITVKSFESVALKLSELGTFKEIDLLCEEAKRRALSQTIDLNAEGGIDLPKSARLMHCNQATLLYRLTNLFECPDSAHTTIRQAILLWRSKNSHLQDQDDLQNQIVDAVNDSGITTDHFKIIDDISNQAKVLLMKASFIRNSFTKTHVANEVGISKSLVSDFLRRNSALQTWVNRNLTQIREHGNPRLE